MGTRMLGFCVLTAATVTASCPPTRCFHASWPPYSRSFPAWVWPPSLLSVNPCLGNPNEFAAFGRLSVQASASPSFSPLTQRSPMFRHFVGAVMNLKDRKRANVEMKVERPKARRPVAVVTGAGNGLGAEVSRRLLERDYHVEGFVEESDFLVVPLDVRHVKSISAAATMIGGRHPDGIDLLVNNAAIAPDGYDYDLVQETMDTNLFGSLNMIRRLVPARWPEALTGNWLPAESGFSGMRAGGLVLNMVCRQAFALLGEPLHLDQQFADAKKDTDLVMRLTSYLGQVNLGVPLEDEWPIDVYYTSKVALEHLTRIVASSMAEQAGKRYEPDISCLALDPGWLRTRLGGDAAPLSVREGGEEVLWVVDNYQSIPSGSIVSNRTVVTPESGS